MSQREFARQANISFRTLQLLEANGHSPNINTLKKLAKALGRPKEGLVRAINAYFTASGNSVREVAARITELDNDRSNAWKGWFFNFVDAFNKSPRPNLIADAPAPDTSHRIQALLASTVEELCAQTKTSVPWWCAGIPALDKPWFVANVENLKALALAQSPTRFRHRNIFVLNNFLDRA